MSDAEKAAYLRTVGKSKVDNQYEARTWHNATFSDGTVYFMTN
jgi:hypothetical protein